MSIYTVFVLIYDFQKRDVPKKNVPHQEKDVPQKDKSGLSRGDLDKNQPKSIAANKKDTPVKYKKITTLKEKNQMMMILTTNLMFRSSKEG